MQQYRDIVDFLQAYMTFDKYCVDEKYYSLLNIYFDTPDNLLIGRSVQKPPYKEKLRLRSYSPPQADSDQVFFEIKKKCDRCVTKRRAIMSYGEAKALIATHQPPELSDDSYINVQVTKEISQMFRRYSGLAPKLFLAYDRLAMFGKDNPELRVTFDRNIRTRRENPLFENGTDGKQLLPEGQILMEIKIPYAIPLWLARYLSEHQIFTTSFSKYGKEYEARIHENRNIVNI